MKKIFRSSLLIVAIAAAAGYATYSFFNDTETSTGNTFTAGTLDLKVDSTQHYDGLICANVGNSTTPNYAWQAEPGVTSSRPELIGQPCSGTWTLKDLLPTGDKFFNFADVKPGDSGEDTISLHVNNNDAWMCAYVNNLANNDNGLTEPESDVDTSDGVGNGELQDNIYMTIWRDTDCDNILDNEGGHCNVLNPDEDDDVAECSAQQNATACNTFDDGDNAQECLWAPGTGEAILANDVVIDSNNGKWPLYAPGIGGGALAGNVDACIGVSWNIPGSVGNIIQSDILTGDISFYVEQARNNPNFQCPDLFAKVGANLGAYVAPTSCTGGTVTGSSSIQTAINAASTGQTVCVDSSYDRTGDNSPISINKDNLTLAGLGTAGLATLDVGVFIDNDGGKVTGLTLGQSTALSETFSVYVNSNVDNAVVSFNQATSAGLVGRGVVNAISTTNNLSILNNKFTGFATGVFLNDSSNMTVDHNTLTGNDVGVSADHPNNSSITFNTIKNNVFEGVGTLVAAADSIHVHSNNIYTNNPAPVSNLDNYAGGTVDATNNWWGGPVAVGINAQNGSAGTVNTAPVAAVAFPEN